LKAPKKPIAPTIGNTTNPTTIPNAPVPFTAPIIPSTTPYPLFFKKGKEKIRENNNHNNKFKLSILHIYYYKCINNMNIFV